MRHIFCLVALVIAMAFTSPCPASQDQESTPADVLRIGTKVSEPFVVERPDGTLTGLSIELWNELATRLGIEFEYVLSDVDGILEGIASGDLDAGIAAISVTPEREQLVDFSHAFYTSGLGIATPLDDGRNGFLRGLLGLMNAGFWIAVGSLALLLLIAGVFAWAAERKHNAEEFGGGLVKGIGNGFWFSAVTMTTVGYGDKSPRTPAGRLIALIWMFTSIIIISAFTGAIASSVTAASLQKGVRGPDDLANARTGTLRNTASAIALRERGVSARGFSTTEEGLAALADGQIDAFVHDAPILAYAIAQQHGGRLRLLDARFNLRPYAIAVPEKSGYLEPLNRALLESTESPRWRERVARWVGD